MVDEEEDVVERGLSANTYEEGRNVGMYTETSPTSTLEIGLTKETNNF